MEISLIAMTGFVADSGTISDDCRLFSGEQQAKWKMIQQNGLREELMSLSGRQQTLHREN